MFDRNGDMPSNMIVGSVVFAPVREVCVICGKELINQPLSNEGGLTDRWSCPIHGTRGVKK